MSLVRFNLPTLVTLTAPTCAGKSFLLEEMASRLGFNRVVSTTDRDARAGEIGGVHYHFLTTEESEAMEAADRFAELVTYNGVRYGVTHDEMADKMSRLAPPMVILEPSGLEIYHKYCSQHGWKVFSIYVSTEESVRLQRLTDRTVADVIKSLRSNHPVEAAVTKVIDANNKRMKAVFDQERSWITKASWDLIVDGTDVERALNDIAKSIEIRNRRSDIYA